MPVGYSTRRAKPATSLIGIPTRNVRAPEHDAAIVGFVLQLAGVTWTAFVLAAITGGLLFASNATTYAHNLYFQVKIALIALAGINMGVYHLFLNRGADAWHTPAVTPMRARIVGVLSLGLWIAIVAFGRWIGFTINTPT
jgi:hypothetical protein